MRLASWNVESIRAHHDQVIEWLAANDVHIACLQETKAHVGNFPRSAFLAAGYELIVFGGSGGRGGVAIASRLPLSDVSHGIPGAVPPLNMERSLSVTVEAETPFRLHTAYAPNGRKTKTREHDVKLAWFALFASWLALDREDHAAQLVLADLNIAPEDIDIWEPARYRRRNLTSPPERRAFQALLAEGELVDAVRAVRGDAQLYTWWNRRSDFYETDRGWRLDHALADPATLARITELTIDREERGREGSTDHAPILVELAP